MQRGDILRTDSVLFHINAVKSCYRSRIKEICLYISFAVSGLGIAALTAGTGYLRFLRIFIKLFPAWFFLGAFVYLFNDIFDKKADKINDRDLPLAKEKVKLKQVIGISFLSLFISLAISLSLNKYVFFLATIFGGLGVIYSIPNIRLKKRIWGKPLTIALALVVSLLGGGISLGIMPIELVFLSLSFGVFTILAYPAADLKDMEGDKKQSVTTIPHIVGVNRTLGLAIIGYSVMLGTVILGYLYYSFNFSAIFLVGIVAVANIIKLYREICSEKKDYKSTCKRSLISATFFPLLFLIAFI